MSVAYFSHTPSVATSRLSPVIKKSRNVTIERNKNESRKKMGKTSHAF
jgi:hypothetical protein